MELRGFIKQILKNVSGFDVRFCNLSLNSPLGQRSIECTNGNVQVSHNRAEIKDHSVQFVVSWIARRRCGERRKPCNAL